MRAGKKIPGKCKPGGEVLGVNSMKYAYNRLAWRYVSAFLD
jgi:hypothetical protein